MQLSLGTVLPSLWERAALQTLFLFCAILLILAQYLHGRRHHLRYLPSPPSLPILRNIFQMDFKNPQITIQKLAREYGNIFCMHVGSLTFMMVSGLPLIKEVLVNQNQVFIDRPQMPIHFHVFKTFDMVDSTS
ncbi:cytochrome P450 2J6-like isoform X2 [Trichosurus vulpecula]|uniref:cytochrome P450 2J6-like isoform X2 n=1 Tax=Trichosurus vulpecula TaxID=9337 RepID=UPI00186B5367|nr:cytochrome P450 2J6-like isoform X2 [Trichosurus vulpecula]